MRSGGRVIVSGTKTKTGVGLGQFGWELVPFCEHCGGDLSREELPLEEARVMCPCGVVNLPPTPFTLMLHTAAASPSVYPHWLAHFLGEDAGNIEVLVEVER